MREAAVAVIRLIPSLSSPLPPSSPPPLSSSSAESPRYLILRRADNPLDPWSGHFAFPGGRRDPEDPSLLAACLRETREECGLELPASALVRALPVTEAGNALGRPISVTPYLFDLAHHPEVTLDPRECAAFHWVPETLLRDRDHQTRVTPLPGRGRSFPAVRLGEGHVWGFTYKVLADLLDLPQD